MSYDILDLITVCYFNIKKTKNSEDKVYQIDTIRPALGYRALNKPHVFCCISLFVTFEPMM